MATNVFVGWKLLGSQMRIRVAPLMRAPRKSSEFLSLKTSSNYHFSKAKVTFASYYTFSKSFDVLEQKNPNQQK